MIFFTKINKLNESLIRSDGGGDYFVVVAPAALGGGRVVEGGSTLGIRQGMDLWEVVRQVSEMVIDPDQRSHSRSSPKQIH